MRLEIDLPKAVPDFRISPAEFAAAERQAATSTLRAGRTAARAEYARHAPEMRKGAINQRVRTYRRKLWIGLDPVNISGLQASERLNPPRPGPGGYGIAGEKGVFLLPRKIQGQAFRRTTPYRAGAGRRASRAIEPVTAPAPQRAARLAAEHAYDFMRDFFPTEMGRQIDRRLEK